ncbi:hypothetical protein SAMN02910317_02901 [Ruminococcaceae bacterium FB2012]|nr:hypothetical protein SAMN02910317_02901 [Ruminococcaceae bacterium FB2012]
MTRKILAAAAALVMCFSMVSCGDTDSSGKDSKSGGVSPWGQAGGDDEESESKGTEKEEESKAESKAESKEEKLTPADTEAPESKAEEVVESKAEEPVDSQEEVPPLINEPEESKEEKTESEAEEITPSAGGITIKGTGYTVSFGEGWVDMAQYKDQIGQMTADAAKDNFGLDAGSFTGMDSVCMYKPNGGETVPVFNVIAPVTNALFKSVTVSQMESVLVKSLETQLAGTKGFKMESKGIKKYNGVEFLELYSEYELQGTTAKARQFFAFYGDKEYVISFSIPGDMYDTMLDETEKVMKTFKFTEG